MARIQVEVGEAVHRVDEGTRIVDLLGRIYVDKERIVAAILNDHLVSLDTRISGDAKIRPVRRTEPGGKSVLRYSATHLFHAVAAWRFPEYSVSVGQSMLGGYFYDVRPKNPESGPPDLPRIVESLNQGLAETIGRDLPFERVSISVDAAERALGPRAGKSDLLSAWAWPVVSMIRLEGFSDLAHGPAALSTGALTGTTVVVHAPGLILRFPEVTAELEVSGCLWDCFRETRAWNRKIGVATIGELNRAVLDDRLAEVIHVSEALHEKKIAAVAEEIARRKDRVRFVCIAGPSSAGKSTFVRRLSVQLRVAGIEPLIVGLDDYYRGRAECPLDEHGEVDFEALEALRLDMIHEHLASLNRGEAVRVPRYDFTHGKPTPEDTWQPLSLGSSQVLLIEGIHGLNPELSQPLPPETVFRIFVDGLTQLVIDEHNRIPTADCRLLRRLVRDRRFRGTTAADSIARWPSVQRGAVRHIFPYQSRADAVFNSALVYESAVLKTFAWRYLLEVPRGHPSRTEAYRLVKFLELFVPVFPDHVPANSVLREFIGGSGFSY